MDRHEVGDGQREGQPEQGHQIEGVQAQCQQSNHEDQVAREVCLRDLIAHLAVIWRNTWVLSQADANLSRSTTTQKAV